MMNALFSDLKPEREEICEGVTLFPAYADSAQLLRKIETIATQAPFRHLVTPGGHTMSVAMTNCAHYGWISDERGYRYTKIDPLTGTSWPKMPDVFAALAKEVAQKAGYASFVPDACLINRYEPGARLTPHQDKNERDMRHPIVSVSLGVPATFQLFGKARGGKPKLIKLGDGDVLIWGGKARLYYHGVKKLESGLHERTGRFRYNLTMRQAG